VPPWSSNSCAVTARIRKATDRFQHKWTAAPEHDCHAGITRRPHPPARLAPVRTGLRGTAHGRCLDGPSRPTSSSRAARVSPSSPIRPCPHDPPEPRYRHHRHERQRRRSAELSDLAWGAERSAGRSSQTRMAMIVAVRLAGPAHEAQTPRLRAMGACRCPRGDSLHAHTPRHLLFRFSDVHDG
jgi:hypothetical protein